MILAAAPAIYVETNFILQLAYRQEQAADCEALLARSTAGTVSVAVPAIVLVESMTATKLRHSDRDRARKQLKDELQELSRGGNLQAATLKARIDALLTGSVQQEESRLHSVHDDIAARGRVLDLSAEIVAEARSVADRFELTTFDAVVFATILSDLRTEQPARSFFLSTDRDAFGRPGIREELDQFGCKWMNSFRNALASLDASGLDEEEKSPP